MSSFGTSPLIRQFRIALAPPFPGLRRFKQGRNFQQWTGDDSKALMKVCSASIATIMNLFNVSIPGVDVRN